MPPDHCAMRGFDADAGWSARTWRCWYNNTDAASAQQTPEIAIAFGVPTTCATLPMNSVPNDHIPLSIKNKLSMRPSKCGGVSICTVELATARKAMLLAPTRTRKNIDNGSERQKENKTKNSAKAYTLVATKCRRRLSLPKDAMPRPAITAPMPGAASSRPNVEGPACKTSVANTGRKRE